MPACQQCGVSVRRQAVDGEESVYNVLKQKGGVTVPTSDTTPGKTIQ